MVNKKIKMMPTIRVLAEGETADFPIEKMLSVKSICTSLSTTMGITLKTSVNREEKIIKVIRLK
ncbi:hypothetical protein [Bacteroides uniformis]|uniref:hypothetical protein n=1 Tax=Bacteroides uniformis TaxID=820 RepID=UPI001C00CC10|nr:hypothetical protein [Bacteroides uniformis]MBT9923517.1 hypothetical protein [Bacteroides uniformis]